MEKNQIKQKISAMLDVPKEIVLNLPVISMVGMQDLTIENYKGIIEYTDERIRISTASGIMRVEGKGLGLRQITAEAVSISGRVARIEFMV